MHVAAAADNHVVPYMSNGKEDVGIFPITPS